MERSTLCVLPYRKIDSSGVLATALGMGRPAVVTDVAACRMPCATTARVLSCRLTMSTRSPAACAELLADPLPRRTRAELAARRALTWDVAAEQHEQVYREVIA